MIVAPAKPLLAAASVLLVSAMVANLKTQTIQSAPLDVPCPSRAASGRIEAGQVQVIFFNPRSGRDTVIDYDGADWTRSENGNLAKRLIKQGFNSSRPLVIYMHAYTQSATSSWLEKIRRNYADDDAGGDQINLMLFDWSYFSRQRYDSAASWAPRLGEVLAKFLIQLQAASDDRLISRTHLVSYSLSTHIAGNAGRYLAKATDQTLARITALDPTGVCFHQRNSQFANQYALQPSDAKLVVARHYDMGTLGASRPIGGVDVFVNGGKNQPSQSRSAAAWPLARFVGLSATSHAVAALNEIQKPTGDCRNVAYACSSYKAFLAGECADCGRPSAASCIDLDSMDATRALANPSNSRSQSKNNQRYKLGTGMFIKTSIEAGCIYHYQAVLRLKSEQPSRNQRKLLEDNLSFVFEGSPRKQLARVNNRLEDGVYTALLTTESDKLTRMQTIQMRLDSTDDRKQKQQLEELAKIIDYLELNYMSNIQPKERAQKSAKFCLSAGSKGILSRC